MISVREDGWVGLGCGVYIKRRFESTTMDLEIHRGSGYGKRDRVTTVSVDDIMKLARELCPEQFVVAEDESEVPTSTEEFNDVLEEDRL
jgi:hypothetical protein